MSETLQDFIKRYQAHDYEWWKLGSGDMQNLFDEAVEKIEQLELKLVEVKQQLAMAEGLETKLHNAEQQIADLKKQVEDVVERAMELAYNTHPMGCETHKCGDTSCFDCKHHWLRTGELK